MNYDSIRQMDTCITRGDERFFDERSKMKSSGVHESCLRAFHILSKTKELLDLGTPASVVRELIDMMETPLPMAEESKK